VPEERSPGVLSRQLVLSHAGTGVLLKLVVAPLVTHDLAQVQAVHSSLHAGDVLVADRGLCSYARLALLVQAGLHARAARRCSTNCGLHVRETVCHAGRAAHTGRERGAPLPVAQSAWR
jgi:hypothetical protein